MPRAVFLKLLDQMRTLCNEETAVTQINYYYDSADFYLLRQQTTLRVRQKGCNYSLQTKQTQHVENGCRISKESKKNISVLPQTIHSAEIGLEGSRCFALLGSLTTIRRRLKISGQAELDFDKNTYEGVTDYEIELEFSGAPPQAVLTLLRDMPANLVSKHQRFLKEKYYDEIKSLDRNGAV